MDYVSWEAARSRAWGELKGAREAFLVATNALSDPPTRDELREWGNCLERVGHHMDNLILILSVQPPPTPAPEPRIRDLVRRRVRRKAQGLRAAATARHKAAWARFAM